MRALAYFLVLILALQATRSGYSRKHGPIKDRYLCRSPRINVVFVHVFKCAGSSLRRVFRVYAHICGQSLATLTDCTFVGKNYEILKDASRLPCAVKDFYMPKVKELSGEKDLKINSPHYSFINMTDIVQGHIRVGMGGLREPVKAVHTTAPGSPGIVGSSKAYYVTWMRNPITMIISAVNFVASKKKSYEGLSKKEQYAKIMLDLKNRISDSDENVHMVSKDRMYSVYSDYFLDHAKNLGTLSSSEVKKRIMRNLDTFQVIGVLENHAVSMSLLRHLIDPVEGIDSSFWRNAAVMESNLGTKKGRVGITTSELTAFIRAHPVLWYNMLECLRDEMEIYEHAVALHIEQCQTFKENDFYWFNLTMPLMPSPHMDPCVRFLNQTSIFPDYNALLSEARARKDALGTIGGDNKFLSYHYFEK